MTNEDGWAKCLSQGFKFLLGHNLLYTFGAGPMSGLRDSTHFPVFGGGAILSALVLRVLRECQIPERSRPIIGAPKCSWVFFTCCCKSHFYDFLKIWRWEWFDLVVLDRLLRATSKKHKKSSTFFRKKVHPIQNPGYAYVSYPKDSTRDALKTQLIR